MSDFRGVLAYKPCRHAVATEVRDTAPFRSRTRYFLGAIPSMSCSIVLTEDRRQMGGGYVCHCWGAARCL